MINKSNKLKSKYLIVLITFGFYASAWAIGSDVTNCKQFINNPDLFSKCQDNLKTSTTTPPKKLQENRDEESCGICDIRQQQRVKKLLEKKKK
jgi:hypothetical protein